MISPLGPRPLDEACVHAELGVGYDDGRAHLGEHGGVAEPGGAHDAPCSRQGNVAAVDEERGADGQRAVQLLLGARNVTSVL